MASEFKAVAQRMVNAENRFIATVCEIAGCSEAEGAKVLRLYLKKRIAKIDIGIGTVNVKHGAFLERDVLRRAISI